ncbi:hypothetical protein DSO57_1006057 [Entomophthora muscae]|uniref:Uncharacterized protein n=1 Tax=Entomophthora muscae TaxID=34485 RepID=A0ACC2U681_9FUNG|nr:hypothetical protein DSO57_1006057 [Entomophthora muscae]
MPASSPNLPTNHSGKLFGIVYIALTGVIDTIIPAVGPWSWVGKSASYLLKLAPLLWWSLPTKTRPKLPLKTMGRLLKTGFLTLCLIPWCNEDLVVPHSEIDLAKSLCTRKCVKQVVNQQQGVLVLDSHFV